MQKKSVRTALTYALPGLVSVGFAVFAAFSERADRAGILFGGAAALVFLLLIFRLLPVFFDFFTENEEKSPCADLGARSRRRLHPWLQIVLSAFIIQFITIAAIYAADMNLNGYSGTVLQAYARLFITGKGSPVCAPDALSGLGLLSALGEYVFPRAIAAGIGVYSSLSSAVSGCSSSIRASPERSSLESAMKGSKMARSSASLLAKEK